MREDVEGVRELDAAAADVGVVGDDELDARIGSDRGAGLGHDLAVHRDLPGQNQRARPLARRGEAAIDEEEIQTRFGPPLTACQRRPLSPFFFVLSSLRGCIFRDADCLASARDDPVGDRPELSLGEPRLDERVLGPRSALVGQLPRPFQAEERRVGGLGAGRVLAGGLAQLLALPSTSRMSSTIWNARPISAPYRSTVAITPLVGAGHDRAAHRRRRE